MNNKYYEYLNNYGNEYIVEENSEDIYPKAVRQNMMPNNFNDMINMQNFMDLEQFDNMDNNSNMNSDCGLYSNYEGFLKGNMFPKLYSPYKGYSPKEMKAVNNKEAMMLKIQELCFALIDMNLYLDIHPNDKCMINRYNKTLSEKKKLVNEYETKYGPIMTDGAGLNKTPWVWDNVSSPWERSY